jgi:hypothetical protein
MNIKINYQVIAAIGITFILFMALVVGYMKSFEQNTSEQEIHILQQPLRIASENNDYYYFLPKGTSLYFDMSLAEGFDRYFVYINVEETNFELSKLKPAKATEQQNIISPLTAYPLENSDDINIIKQFSLDKNNIKRILDAGFLSTDDALAITTLLQKYIEAKRRNE